MLQIILSFHDIEIMSNIFVFEGHCFGCKNQGAVNMRHPAVECLYVAGHEDCQFPFMWDSLSELTVNESDIYLFEDDWHFFRYIILIAFHIFRMTLIESEDILDGHKEFLMGRCSSS